MLHEGLGNLLADGVDGIERGHGLLEDEGDDAAPQRLARSLVEAVHVLPLHDHFAPRVGVGAVMEPEDRPRVTLFPEPDSPSSASTFPASSEKDTSFTARTVPSRVSNDTQRSRTVSKAMQSTSECRDHSGIADRAPAERRQPCLRGVA